MIRIRIGVPVLQGEIRIDIRLRVSAHVQAAPRLSHALRELWSARGRASILRSGDDELGGVVEVVEEGGLERRRPALAKPELRRAARDDRGLERARVRLGAA